MFTELRQCAGYETLKVGNIVICIENFIMNEDDEVAFTENKEYEVKEVILDRDFGKEVKIIALIDDQGDRHLVDNEYFDFSTHFRVKKEK